MAILSRWFALAVLAAGLGFASLFPATAHAQSGHDLARVIIDVADVMYRSGQPYYRHGNYGYNDRVIVVRDRYGRPTYYRQVPRHASYYRPAPRHVVHHRPVVRHYAPPAYRHGKCNGRGKCKVRYYDPRRDQRHDYGYDYRSDHRNDHNDRGDWDDRRYSRNDRSDRDDGRRDRGRGRGRGGD